MQKKKDQNAVPDVDLAELERYLRIFQENPDSRVFAPLADMYRRLGRIAEAEEICREGMQRHPYYAGGRVALAHILLEASRFDEALVEADAVVTYYPDNLLARKILIRVLGGMNLLDRAKREYGALCALAPQMASDPEIERALQGPSKAKNLPQRPHAPKPPKHTFNPLELQEKTAWDARPESTKIRPSQKHQLLRKKKILESWIRRLGS